jgi:DNA-binding MarR family transcriptional regulator
MIDTETIIAEKLVSTTIVKTTFVCKDEGVSEQATATKPTRTAHGEAWGALARTHAAITGRLQEALAAADFPPLPWYEVLATLAEAPEERMKMGDLAEALVITRGGLTKLVDRLIKAGLLERTFCETDRRVSYATLMPAGRDLLDEMRPVVVAELKVAFAAKLSAIEADALRETLERVRVSACGTE